jgi:hypothetical protein
MLGNSIRDVIAQLTERQREILTVALELDYYTVPQRTTRRNIANRVGLSVGTVVEHLRPPPGPAILSRNTLDIGGVTEGGVDVCRSLSMYSWLLALPSLETRPSFGRTAVTAVGTELCWKNSCLV